MVSPATGSGRATPAPGPVFRHDEAGTTERAWQDWGGLQGLPQLDVDTWTASGDAHLVLLAAHPDDETLGAGGLLAIAAEAGARVDVVVATAGEGSHPASRTHSPEALARWRAEEVTRAVHLLAPEACVHQLGLPDGRLREHGEDLRRALLDLVTGSCWLVAPWRGDAHTDHEAAGEVAAEVAATCGAQLLEYPVWAWHWAAPGDDRVPWDAAVSAAPPRPRPENARSPPWPSTAPRSSRSPPPPATR